MKNLMKPAALIPTLIGVVVGALLFVMGYAATHPDFASLGLLRHFCCFYEAYIPRG